MKMNIKDNGSSKLCSSNNLEILMMSSTEWKRRRRHTDVLEGVHRIQNDKLLIVG